MVALLQMPRQLKDSCPDPALTNTSHSAVNVAAIKTTVLGKYNLQPTDISLATEDGASNNLSNNKKSAKLLGQPFKVCFPHDMGNNALQLYLHERADDAEDLDARVTVR